MKRMSFGEFMGFKGWGWLELLWPTTLIFMPIFIFQYFEYKKTGKMPDPEL